MATFALLPIAAIAIAAIAVLYYMTRPPTDMFPCSLLQVQVPDHADTEVTVSGLEPGAKVLFWAAEPKTDGLARINDWRKAYLTFANAGVAAVGESGHAVLRIRKPQPYTVPVVGRLDHHVHWRVCRNGGRLGPVQTTPLPDAL
jgi:hypothetical protein